jgi:hypothetical protein
MPLFGNDRRAMTGTMFRKTLGIAALMLSAGLFIRCGTSTTGPDGGSKMQTQTGVTATGYPSGEPKDAGSPALASSTESQYSRDQKEKAESQKGAEPAK